MTKSEAKKLEDAARKWIDCACEYELDIVLNNDRTVSHSDLLQQEKAFLDILNSMITAAEINKIEMRIAAEYTDEHAATKSVLYFARCPVCHANLDWAETGNRFVAAKTDAELAAENAQCNAAYLAKKTE